MLLSDILVIDCSLLVYNKRCKALLSVVLFIHISLSVCYEALLSVILVIDCSLRVIYEALLSVILVIDCSLRVIYEELLSVIFLECYSVFGWCYFRTCCNLVTECPWIVLM